MSFEKGFTRRIEKDQNAAAGRTIDITAKKSIGDITGDEEESRQFSLYLESKRNRTATLAWKRYIDGAPTEADEGVIESHYDEYQVRKESFEKVFAAITSFTDDMLTHSPVFKKFRDAKGGENIRFVLEHGLRDLALTDTVAFDPIKTEIQKLSDLQKEEDALDKKLQEFTDKNGVADDKKLRDAMAHTSPHARREALQAILLEGMSTKAVVWDWVKEKFGKGTYKKVDALAREDVNRLIAERKSRSQSAGNFLKSLLVRDPEFRHALARLDAGKEPALTKGADSMSSLTEMKTGMDSVKKEAAIERAKAFRKAHAKDRWRDPRTRDRLREEFYTTEEIAAEEFKKKKGFFARLIQGLASIFESRGDADVEDILK
ncbi:hypothetical protein K8R03_03905 [Candidatus Kaiserbacteria bacterium]|nr:hypothetical protein [Candidatus Kaiserbacteria bacterium]